jgi:hypothetical protein
MGALRTVAAGTGRLDRVRVPSMVGTSLCLCGMGRHPAVQTLAMRMVYENFLIDNVEGARSS